jgi:hypothetical protein
MLFHFQVRTVTHVMLTEAAELVGTEEARVEAARRIGELLKQHANELWTDGEWQMDVTDGRGLILFVIQISAVRTAATSGGASALALAPGSAGL